MPVAFSHNEVGPNTFTWKVNILVCVILVDVLCNSFIDFLWLP